MNSSSPWWRETGRLAWKEFRFLRDFAGTLLIVGLCFVSLAVGAEAVEAPEIFRASAHMLTLIALKFFPALCALGCGASLFAAEKEENTRDLLRAMPVTAGSLLVGKLAAAAGLTLALGVVLHVYAASWQMMLTSVVPWESQPAAGHWGRTLYQYWWLGPIVCLGWSTFCSLFLSRAIHAAALATVLMVVVEILASSVDTEQTIAHSRLDWEIWRVILSGLLLLSSVVLVHRWLGTKRAGHSAAASTMEEASYHRPASAWWRLVWQAARGNLWALLAPVVLVSAFHLFTIQHTTAQQDYGWLMVHHGLLATLLGCGVFHGDQSGQQFRFFAQQGVSPGKIWWSRQLWGMAVLLVAGLAMLWLPVVWQTTASVNRVQSLDELASRTFLGITGRSLLPLIWLGGYAVGQWASLWISRGLLAYALGLATVLVASFWVVGMRTFGIPLWWSVWPLVLAFFVASWARRHDWLRERGTYRAWGKAWSCLAVPAALILCAIPFYRVYQIPLPEGTLPGEEVLAAMPEDPRATEVYRRAVEAVREVAVIDKYTSPPTTFPEGEVDLPALDAVLVAIEQPLRLRIHAFTKEEPIDLHLLANYLKHAAVHYTQQGDLASSERCIRGLLKLTRRVREQADLMSYTFGAQCEDMAGDALLAWWSHEDQTPERLVDMVVEVDAHRRSVPPLLDALKRECALQHQLWESVWETGEFPLEVRVGSFNEFVFRNLPWERARARRLWEFQWSAVLQDAETMQENIESGQSPFHGILDPRQPYHPSTSVEVVAAILTYQAHFHTPEVLARTICTPEAHRRSLVLRTLMQAWKRETGEYPQIDQIRVAMETPRSSEITLVAEPLRDKEVSENIFFDPFFGKLKFTVATGRTIQVDGRVRLHIDFHDLSKGTWLLWSAGVGGNVPSTVVVHLGFSESITPEHGHALNGPHGTEWVYPLEPLPPPERGQSYRGGHGADYGGEYGNPYGGGYGSGSGGAYGNPYSERDDSLRIMTASPGYGEPVPYSGVPSPEPRKKFSHREWDPTAN